MNLLRLIWLPLLFIASYLGASIDLVFTKFNWQDFATIVLFAIICLFFYAAIKANKANKAKSGHEQ